MGVEVEESPPTTMLAALLSSFQTEECEQSVLGGGATPKSQMEGRGAQPGAKQGPRRSATSTQVTTIKVYF